MLSQRSKQHGASSSAQRIQFWTWLRRSIDAQRGCHARLSTCVQAVLLHETWPPRCADRPRCPTAPPDTAALLHRLPAPPSGAARPRRPTAPPDRADRPRHATAQANSKNKKNPPRKKSYMRIFQVQNPANLHIKNQKQLLYVDLKFETR